MDPKQFQNDSVSRKRFARANVHDISPTLDFICNIMEKHVKKDQRKEGRYNLVYLIEMVEELKLKNVPMESLSGNYKELLETKPNSAIEDSYKSLWSKKKESNEYLQAHKNEYTTSFIK